MTHANNNGCEEERWHVDLHGEEIRFSLICAASVTKTAANAVIAASGEIASHSLPAFRKSGVAQVSDKMVSNSAQGRKKNQVQLSLVYWLILADLAVTQQISQDFRRLTGMRLHRDWSLIIFLSSCSSLSIKSRETNGNQTFIPVSHLCQLALLFIWHVLTVLADKQKQTSKRKMALVCGSLL